MDKKDFGTYRIWAKASNKYPVRLQVWSLVRGFIYIHVCKQRRLWWDSPELSLLEYAVGTKNSWAGPYFFLFSGRFQGKRKTDRHTNQRTSWMLQYWVFHQETPYSFSPCLTSPCNYDQQHARSLSTVWEKQICFLYEGCSNMNASSFITFFTYMLRQNGKRFYKGLYVTFKLALSLKKNTVPLSCYSSLNEGHVSILTNSMLWIYTRDIDKHIILR